MNRSVQLGIYTFGVLLFVALSPFLNTQITNDSLLFRLVDMQVISQKIEKNKKYGRVNSLLKKVVIPAAIGAGAVGAYLWYNRSSSSPTSKPQPTYSREQFSVALENSKKKMTEIMINKPLSKLPLLSPLSLNKKEQSDVNVIVLPEQRVWINGFPFKWSEHDGLKKLFFCLVGMSILQTGSMVAANQFWSTAYSMAKKLYHQPFLPGISSHKALNEYEKEIVSLLHSLQITQASLAHSNVLATDTLYFKKRLARTSALLTEAIENFVSMAAYQAWQKNDLTTYSWLVDSSNGLISSANALIGISKKCFEQPLSIDNALFNSTTSSLFEAVRQVSYVSGGYHEK